jgi:hypothetical protein
MALVQVELPNRRYRWEEDKNQKSAATLSNSGTSANGTPLRADGSPINFAGDKADYDRYLATEAERAASNTAWNTGDNGRLETLKNTGYDIGPNPAYASGSTRSSRNPYSAAQRAAEEAIQKQIKQRVGELESQISDAEGTYDEAARQLYIQYRQNQAKRPAQTAGLESGMADALSRRDSLEYENMQGQTKDEREKTRSQIESQIQKVKSQGEAELDENEEKYAQMAKDYLANLEMQAYANLAAQQEGQAADGEALGENAIRNIALRLIQQGMPEEDILAVARSYGYDLGPYLQP